MGNRMLGLLLLALAATVTVSGSDGVHARPVVMVTAGPGENPTATAPAAPTTPEAAPSAAEAPPVPGEAASSTTTTVPAAPTSSTAPAAAPSDQVLVQQMVLQVQDLPAGFAQQPPGSRRSGATGGEDAFDSCLGPDTAALRRALVARARSAGFVRRPATVASSAAAIFDTPASASRVMAVLRSEAARSCLEKRANDRLADDPAFPDGSSGTMSRIVVGSFGEESRAYRLEVHMPQDGGRNTTYLADFLFVRKGRAVVMVQFGSLDQPFPTPDAQAVAGRLAARL